MDEIAKFLIEKETITGKEFMKILSEVKEKQSDSEVNATIGAEAKVESDSVSDAEAKAESDSASCAEAKAESDSETKAEEMTV